MLEGYVTVQEIAKKWGVSARTVQHMCVQGKIKGVAKFGRSWAIPQDAPKPTDNRMKSGKYVDWRKNLGGKSKE